MHEIVTRMHEIATRPDRIATTVEATVAITTDET
jgi:hypothetical protein